MNTNERSMVMIKPDGIQRGYCGKLIKIFEDKGYKLIALKLTKPSVEMLETHYQHNNDKSFFQNHIKYMSSCPVIAMIWEGKDVIKTVRKMLGLTNPVDSEPGTIRGDLCQSPARNILHASDSQEGAEEEIKSWFSEDEIFTYSSSYSNWVYETES
jgi:nucleoside-diphosphate kinase